MQAREVRGLARRLVGSTDLLGQVFRWGGEDYLLVNDIAPGTTLSGGQAMMAYACCVKKRVASAGPLSEHNSAFDIRAVRERIEGDRMNEEALVPVCARQSRPRFEPAPMLAYLALFAASWSPTPMLHDVPRAGVPASSCTCCEFQNHDGAKIRQPCYYISLNNPCTCADSGWGWYCVDQLVPHRTRAPTTSTMAGRRALVADEERRRW